jgi:hypothetical protein
VLDALYPVPDVPVVPVELDPVVEEPVVLPEET